MNVGQFNRLVTIKKPSSIKNAFGQPVNEWEKVGTMWVSIEPLLGKNYYEAQQTQTNANIKIRSRYNSKVKRNMRIYHNDTAYDVIDVIPPKMRYDELVIMCKEVVL